MFIECWAHGALSNFVNSLWDTWSHQLPALWLRWFHQSQCQSKRQPWCLSLCPELLLRTARICGAGQGKIGMRWPAPSPHVSVPGQTTMAGSRRDTGERERLSVSLTIIFYNFRTEDPDDAREYSSLLSREIGVLDQEDVWSEHSNNTIIVFKTKGRRKPVPTFPSHPLLTILTISLSRSL